MNHVGPYGWLVAAAASSELTPETPISLAPDASTEEAWRLVAEQCDVPLPQLAQTVAEHFGLAVADLAAAQSTAAGFVPRKVALKHQVFPLRVDYATIVVATADPTNLDAEQDIAFAAGRKVCFEIAVPDELAEAVGANYSPERQIETVLDNLGGAEVPIHLLEIESPEDLSSHDVQTAPVVKLTNAILSEAINRRASDIHLQPKKGSGVVRFRVDGVLRDHVELPFSVLHRVVSRVKIMGGLDIANRLRPQDGRSRVGLQDRVFDLRISTVPTREAEKAVIRILDPETAAKGLGALRMLQPELEKLRRMLCYREGIVLVTGPTGSGKTTTLYGALRELATDSINIMTVEDPVEYELPGLTQIQVEEKQGLTFASALRSILRQDPDVIFVGEIRDAETAEIALQASMTGHLVLATLHTNDAVGTIPRLEDLGLDQASIAGALRGAVAQRLARRVCDQCAAPAEPPFTEEEERLRAFHQVDPVVRAVGCSACGGTGYRGRIPFVESMVMTPVIEKLIQSGSTYSELNQAAVGAGMRPLHQAGLERVRSGETTLEELDRVVGEVSDLETESAKPSQRDAGVDATESANATGTHRVLVVDDDGAYRTIARALLEKEGYSVVEANDGSVALDKLANGDGFDLVVLDLDMPEVGGREVLTQLRETPARATLPVIVLTGTVDPDAEVTLLENGADDYLRKPMDPERFMVRVKATLRRSQRAA